MRLPYTAIIFFLLLLPIACTYDTMEVVANCDTNLAVQAADITPSACGIPSGSFMGEVSGTAATGEVQYSLNGVDFQSLPTFVELVAGSYTLTVRQGACTAATDLVIENSEGLNAAATSTAADCGIENGKIEIITSGASGLVSYSLNGGSGQAAADFTGLAPGDYQLTAEDEIGCVVTLEVSVFSRIAFAEVETIVTASCAVSGCHAGNVSPDFRVQANILGRAGRIASRIGNATMPPAGSGRTLTTAQIDAIACWVADGAPE